MKNDKAISEMATKALPKLKHTFEVIEATDPDEFAEILNGKTNDGWDIWQSGVKGEEAFHEIELKHDQPCVTSTWYSHKYFAILHKIEQRD